LPVSNLRQQLKRESMNVSMQLIFSKRFGVKPTDDFKKLVFAVEYIFKNLSRWAQIPNTMCEISSILCTHRNPLSILTISHSGNPGDMIPVFRVFPTPMLWEMQVCKKCLFRVLAYGPFSRAISLRVRSAW
jgi:hypothetical protein